MKIDRKYLPSRNFVIALVIAVLIILTVLLFKYINNKNDNNTIITTSTSTSEKWVDNIDSDGDGLPDWQETLYGTDKNNADTDGDGTNDGQEIKDGRDPLKANTSTTTIPNDKTETVLPEEKTSTTSQKTITQTDMLALNLLSDINYSKDASGQLTNAQVKYIADNAVNNIVLSGEKYKGTTKVSDLNFVSVNNQNILNYINFYYDETEKLRLILNRDIVIIKGTDLEKNPEERKTLDNIILKYKTITNDFIKTPIPGGSVWATTYHLAIINQLEKITQIDKDLIDFNIDPVKSAPALASYTKENMQLLSILTIMDKIFLINRTPLK